MTQDGLQDRAPEAAALARVAAQPVEERNLPLLDLVAEPGEHCREHRQRADHGDADDHHRADRKRHERRLAGEEHPGHGDHDREAGDEHCPARGRGGGFESSALAPTGLALVPFPAKVEERVVDADGQPDQQDDLLNLPVHRHELAHDRDEPHGREDRGQTDQDRDERRDERAEHEQQDEDRQRQRDHPGLGDPAIDQLVERLLGRDACLAHVEGGVRLLHPGGGGGDRVDVFRRLVVVPARLEGDQDGVPVGRDLALVAGGQRRTQLLDLREGLERANRLVDHGAEGWIVDGLRLRLHDARARTARSGRGRTTCRESCSPWRTHRHRRPSAGSACIGKKMLVANATTTNANQAKHRGLPVACAPTTHAGRDVVRLECVADRLGGLRGACVRLAEHLTSPWNVCE